MTDPHDLDDDDYGNECENCGGEGYVSNCFEEWACVSPYEGCDLCTSRCDWCNPPPKRQAPSGLQQVLADALGKADKP